MARKKSDFQEDFSDLPDEGTAGTFADIPMPSQEQIDSAADGEKMPRQRRSAPKGFRPIDQIVNEFLAVLTSHPDANLLTSSMGGKPPQGAKFPGTPESQQHMVELRFAWRNPVVQEIESDTPSAFSPGGKYYDLVRRDDTVSETNEGGKDSWKHLVKERETAAV